MLKTIGGASDGACQSLSARHEVGCFSGNQSDDYYFTELSYSSLFSGVRCSSKLQIVFYANAMLVLWVIGKLCRLLMLYVDCCEAILIERGLLMLVLIQLLAG